VHHGERVVMDLRGPDDDLAHLACRALLALELRERAAQGAARLVAIAEQRRAQ
jgi:hypothetical protein